MLIVTVVTAIVFYAMDTAAKGVDVRLTTSAIALHGMNLADVSIFTAFLGHGLAASILLVYLFPPLLPKPGFRRLGL
jgi:hypothetical protein